MTLRGLIRLVIGDDPRALDQTWRCADDVAWVSVLVTRPDPKLLERVAAINAAQGRTAIHLLPTDLGDTDAMWSTTSRILRGLAEGIGPWTEPAIDAVWVCCPDDRAVLEGTLTLIDVLRPYWASGFAVTVSTPTDVLRERTTLAR